MKHKGIVDTILVLILASALAAFSSPVAAADAAVSVTAPAQVAPGDDFIASIVIPDLTDFDAGNYDVTYNPALIEVKTDVTGAPLVASGNISGTVIPVSACDFVPSGTQGTIRIINNVQDAPGVTGSGYLAEIHFRAIGSGGAVSAISLSNGILGDNLAGEITATWTGSTVQVGTSSASTVGGSTGGGGGGVVGEKRITPLMGITSQNFQLLEDVEALSVDVHAILFIKKGTFAVNSFGSFLTGIIVETLVVPPENSPNTEFVGSVYDIGPNGAQFEPAALLTLTYNEESIPAGIMESNLYIALWNEATQAWEKIACTVDPENHVINAYVNHFSTYAVMAGTRPADLILSDLTVTPVESGMGKDVTVSVLVTNKGDLAGSDEIILTIDNEVKQTQTVNLESQESQTVSFSVSSGPAGEHTVNVNNLLKIFVVTEPAAATPPPASEPSPETATLPALTTEPSPTTAPPAVTAPTPVGTLPVQPTNNWMVIILSIAGGILVITALVFLYIRRKRVQHS